jgi:type IV secretion system protein VirB8
MATDAAVEAYLAEAASWDRDRAQAAQRNERRAWVVAGAGWAMAGLAVAAVLLLTPLKRVVPFVIRVDNSTGIVDVVPPLDAQASVSQTVTRYLLTHYVSVCERFNLSTAESDYAECGAFHTPQLNAAWYAKWNPGNPDSPLNRYKDGTELEVAIQAVSFLDRANGLNDLAQVRYTIVTATGGGLGAGAQWIATIQYAYVEPSSDPAVRRWNPLGFRIVAFHREGLADGSSQDKTRPAAQGSRSEGEALGASTSRVPWSRGADPPEDVPRAAVGAAP